MTGKDSGQNPGWYVSEKFGMKWRIGLQRLTKSGRKDGVDWLPDLYDDLKEAEAVRDRLTKSLRGN